MTRARLCNTRLSALAMACAALAGAPPAPALAQMDEDAPVYIASAPFAEEALETVGDLLARGGTDEGVRLLQRVLDEHADRLIASDEPGLFVSVRQRVHERLASDPDLLEAYRQRQTPRARALLGDGDWALVARAYWMTAPGFEASLREAQTLIESGSFGAGVRVLGRLLDHPDAGANAADAAGLAGTGASYADTRGAWAIADRWAGVAGLPLPDRVAAERPQRTAEPVARALEWSAPPAEPAALDGVVARALHAGELTELDPGEPPEPATGPSAARRVEMPWALPTLAGPDLFTNDGLTLTCFDRFTMRVKWRVRDQSGRSEPGDTRQARTRLGRIVEDTTTVTVRGDLVYASMGLSRGGVDDSVGRVVCVDRATGRTVWSAPLGAMGDDLQGAEPRGPLILAGDTLVVGARKNLRSRRVVSLALVGLDARTGQVRWSRALGSAGSLPFQQLTQLAEGGVLRDGVVYWTDKIGIVGAVEAATGRVLWVRQTRAPGMYTRGVRTAYTTSSPVVTDDALLVLTPDQTAILQLDPPTGAVLATRGVEPVTDAQYLVGLADRVALVGATRVGFFDPERFDAPLVVTPQTDAGAPRGRAVAAGTRLAVPVATGLALIDPDTGRAEAIELDATGNVVLADGQIVVVDETQARSFLSWEIASTMLDERVAEGDLDAALALAELAQRAGHEERMVDAIDAAVRLAGLAADAPAARARVFDAVRPLADAQAGRPGVGLATRGALLPRLGAVARTHEQRVAHAMAVGAWRSATGDVPGAAGVYQEILLDQPLARAIWRGGGLSVRAELEATRRLNDLADRHGERATGAGDAMARAELDALGHAASAMDLAALARRYPVSTVAPAAWARAAAVWLGEQRWAGAERAARTGLRAAVQNAGRSRPVPDEVAGELVGVLVSALAAQGRQDEADEALADAGGRFDALVPTVQGRAIALADADRPRRHPALGERVSRTEHLVLVTGVPVPASVPGPPGLALMHAPQIGELAAHRAADLASGSEAHAAPLWRDADVGSMPPLLVHADQKALVLVWPDELGTMRGARAEAREPDTGRVLWTAAIRPVIDRVDPGPDPAARVNGQIAPPLEGGVSNAHLLATADARTLVVSDRLGRAVGVDLADGRTLWSRRLAPTRLYGLDSGGGVLGVCGVSAVNPGPRDADAFDTALRGVGEAVDMRTGETIQLLDELGAETRWVRVAPDGQVLVAAASRIVSMDTLAGRIDWANADEQLASSQDAWIVGEHLVVLGQDRMLWPVSRREGVRRRTALNTDGRAAERGSVAVERRPFGLVVAGSRGVTTHAPDGELLAADALGAVRAFAMASLGERRAAVVDRAYTDDDGRTTLDVVIVDAETGKIDDRVTVTLPPGIRRSPGQVALADGVVVIGFNEVSVALAVPLTDTN